MQLWGKIYNAQFCSQKTRVENFLSPGEQKRQKKNANGIFNI